MTRPLPFFNVEAHRMEKAQWQAGPGQGWKDVAARSGKVVKQEMSGNTD